jgi:aryl sulfotransferase
VAISSSYKSSVMLGREVSRKACVDRILRERLPWESWYKHVESWWPHRNDENVLYLTYEGVVGDLAGTARKVARFCGIEIDERDLPRIVERCSIGFMKQHWDKFDPRLRRVSRTPAEFIRKGVVGDGRSALTPDQETLASRRLARLASKLGCIPGEPHSELFA